MALNYIWIAFFLIAIIVALIKLVFFGDTEIFTLLVNSTFDNAKTGFEISLGLTGVLTLWLGLMKIGEKGGVIRIFSKLISPLFQKLFPDLPKNHPAMGAIILNISANMLGLDNAATPMGLKAMEEMQKTNPDKETASNSQIMFYVLNASGLTIIPISIMTYRAQQGAANPADVFIPILIATFFSTLAGLIAVAIYQKLNLFNKVVLTYLGGLTAFIIGLLFLFSQLEQSQIELVSNLASAIILLSIITSFFLLAIYNKVNVYEAFIEGAKEGFGVAIKIIPYLIAILVGVGIFRASGALDYLVDAFKFLFTLIGVNTDFVEALPTAFMKPLSGSGARGLMIDTMKTFGADSFVARVASTIQGASDTTFYILAVYFGAVGIKKTKYALTCGLIADLFGAIAAITVAYIFFH